MSNLEHLVENGLIYLKEHSYEEWREHMKHDRNWQGNGNITLDNLWEICQYIIYVWDEFKYDRKTEPTVMSVTADHSYPTMTGMCMHCLRMLDEEWSYCPYCGQELIWPRKDQGVVEHPEK